MSKHIEQTGWCTVCERRVLVRRQRGGHLWEDQSWGCTQCGTKQVYVGEAAVQKIERQIAYHRGQLEADRDAGIQISAAPAIALPNPPASGQFVTFLWFVGIIGAIIVLAVLLH